MSNPQEQGGAGGTTCPGGFLVMVTPNNKDLLMHIFECRDDFVDFTMSRSV